MDIATVYLLFEAIIPAIVVATSCDHHPLVNICGWMVLLEEKSISKNRRYRSECISSQGSKANFSTNA